MSKEQKDIRRDMVMGDNHTDCMQAQCETSQEKNQRLIRSLYAMNLPDELIEESKEAASEGSSVLLVVIDEVRLMEKEHCKIPWSLQELILEECGEYAARMFLDLCEGSDSDKRYKDYREKQGRLMPPDD